MPDLSAAGGAPRKGAPDHVYTVSELTFLIKGKLESSFARVWVEGEISGLKTASSGHTYFNLKDEQSLIKAVFFKGSRRGLRFEPEDGLKVVAAGQVSVYAPRGDYQLIVESLEPRGFGALQLAFEQLKKKLAAEGLFDEGRKRPIPFLPASVGVVTSPTGAAIRDIIHVMRRRFAGVGIFLYPVRVQGEGAAREIAEGIRAVNRWGKVDVIIVGRGGGSLEDLWAFNEEVVARAIYESRLPVISAVGHEVDFTIADFVADLRAPTPSAAAELVVKNRQNLARDLGQLGRRLGGTLREALSRRVERLESLSARPVMARPEGLLAVPRQRVDEAGQGLVRVFGRRLVEKRYRREQAAARLARFDPRARLEGWRRELPSMRRRLMLAAANGLESRKKLLGMHDGRMHALSPLAVLGRGYSICRAVPGGEVISDAARVRPGDGVSVVLHRGTLDCRVLGTGGK